MSSFGTRGRAQYISPAYNGISIAVTYSISEDTIDLHGWNAGPSFLFLSISLGRKGLFTSGGVNQLTPDSGRTLASHNACGPGGRSGGRARVPGSLER